ncbi:hypothetical protein COCNU_02G006920 [Cocos nucifera]|uniref:Uncharacterized protein n=1 Tax=Cocos nucifera TaxID=13894 RepID=A0A8K0MX16_COCNU|nr:hypothetical protein COCNU_02G006920 [Cocos nucifera]
MELEEMVSSRDKTVAARDKVLLVFHRDVENWKAAVARAMEDYKSFKAFQKEVTEASKEAFDCGFNSCKDLVGKLFSNLDLSGAPLPAPKVTAEQLHPVEAPILVKVPTPTEVPTPVETLAIEVISLEDDQAVAPAKASQANA